jgi:uncharacterized protein YbjQ (UPF0145 family)
MFSGVAPTSAASRVLIVTMNEIPGYEIVAVHGDVFGIIVPRPQHVFEYGCQPSDHFGRRSERLHIATQDEP